MTVRDHIDQIKVEIEKLNPEVKLVVVTKYASLDQMKQAYSAGVRCFAENYVKQALDKMEALKGYLDKELEWHLIGHLQKNKVKKAVGKFNLIQSVDSLELCELIDKAALEQGLSQDILIQINATAEPQKSGFSPEEFKKVSDQILKLKNINVKGLMTIGPNQKKNPADLETVFNLVRHLQWDTMPSASILSMGMSDDYKVAIKCGSNMIRVGRKIFEQKERN